MTYSSSISVDPPETEWENLLHRMAKLRADLTHLQQQATESDVPAEIQSTVNFAASDFENLIRDLIKYEMGGEMPDECPVCGEEVTSIEELDPGESYDVDRFCVEEKTTGGPGHGILHWSQEGPA